MLGKEKRQHINMCREYYLNRSRHNSSLMMLKNIIRDETAWSIVEGSKLQKEVDICCFAVSISSFILSPSTFALFTFCRNCKKRRCCGRSICNTQSEPTYEWAEHAYSTQNGPVMRRNQIKPRSLWLWGNGAHHLAFDVQLWWLLPGGGLSWTCYLMS